MYNECCRELSNTFKEAGKAFIELSLTLKKLKYSHNFKHKSKYHK